MKLIRLIAVLLAAAGGAASAQTESGAPSEAAGVAVGEAPQEAADAADPDAFQPQTGESVAAVVNDEPISTFDVRQRTMLMLATTGAQPDDQTIARMQEQALRQLIDEKLQLQEARRWEVEVEDDQVNGALARLARQNNVTVDDIVEDLASAGIYADTLRSQIRSELAWQFLVDGRYSNRVRVSDDQIEETRERIVNSLSKPRYLIAEIFLPIESVGEEQRVRDLANSLIQQMVDGAEFPVLAQEYSEAPSASVGGDAGWVLAGELRPEVESVLREMPPGRVSPPIRVPGGIYLIALRDKSEGSVVNQLRLASITLPTPEGADAEAIADAEAALSRAAASVSSCEAAEDAASGLDGAFATNLGSLSENALQPRIKEAVAAIEVGQATAPIRTPLGPQVFILCDRQVAAEGVPSRDEIANQLRNQRQSLLARRYLRDVRRGSTIDLR